MATDRDRILFTDLGELDHFVYLFGEYQHWPQHCPIATMERGGPWVHCVHWFRTYLERRGVTDARTLTASDLVHKVRFARATDVRAAMQCLSLLLSHDSTHNWDDDAVQDLRRRLTTFCAIFFESRVSSLAARAQRGESFVHGRPKGAKGPLKRVLKGICAHIKSTELDAVLGELKRRAEADDETIVEYDAEHKLVWVVLRKGDLGATSIQDDRQFPVPKSA